MNNCLQIESGKYYPEIPILHPSGEIDVGIPLVT